MAPLTNSAKMAEREAALDPVIGGQITVLVTVVPDPERRQLVVVGPLLLVVVGRDLEGLHRAR